MKYFDPAKKQLIEIKRKATPDFWDSHWEIDAGIRNKIMLTKNNFVSNKTKKYLGPKDGIILEAGCGIGTNVASLVNNGYKCVGLDYAEKTVRTLNKYVPELDIRLGDVRKLPFENGYFAGCWSWGVIEHFWEGYQAVALEMSRVTREKGYLFLVFPSMSCLRKLKASLGLYELWQDKETDEFYQFILNPKQVVADFEQTGFKLIKASPFDAVKGLKSEIRFITGLLQPLYDYKGRNILVRSLQKSVEVTMSPVAGHSSLLIFRKQHQ